MTTNMHARYNFQMPRGQYIREWRKRMKMTLEDLAEAVGSSKSYMSDIERGAKRYNEDTLTLIASALSCKPWQLLLGPPESQEQPAKAPVNKKRLRHIIARFLAERDLEPDFAEILVEAMLETYSLAEESGWPQDSLDHLDGAIDAALRQVEREVKR